MTSLAFGCAIAKSKVDIQTDPAGADVVAKNGETLGVTPLTLEGGLLEKAVSEGRLYIGVRHRGYAPKFLILDLEGYDSHQIQLTKLDELYYANEALPALTPQLNEITRELLQIQGLIIVRNIEEAARRLDDFRKRYPNVAAGYVMLATLSVMKGLREDAIGYLQRAKSIDPSDPEVDRILSGLKNQEAAR